MNDVAASNPFIDLLRRLRTSVAWVAAQFWVTLLLILAGVAWTRLPDSYAWQVVLTLLVPLVLLAAALLLEAGTMRALFHDEQRRAHFWVGTLMVLVWTAVAWAAWALLDWCSGQIPEWAGYLNSRFAANQRATLFTYDHIESWLTFLVWIFRWIVVPAKVIPHAVASAQWGWRLPWLRVWRMLLNWRWWFAVIIAALVAVEWPSHFFTGEPHGTVSHQVWAVMLKLAGVYLLGVVCWVLLLAWCGVLFSGPRPHHEPPSEESLVPAPVGLAPLGEDSVKLPLPEGDHNSSGNA